MCLGDRRTLGLASASARRRRAAHLGAASASLTPRRAERMPRSMALTRSTVFTSFASVHGIL
jgi:hypothetical protein